MSAHTVRPYGTRLERQALTGLCAGGPDLDLLIMAEE